MTEPRSDEKAAYEAMRDIKEKFGAYHKTCFHIHTPESYDYKLRSDWTCDDFKSASDEDLRNLCIEKKVFPEEFKIDDIESNEKLKYFSNVKECYAFLLVAQMIITNDIELALVTDHHTVKGFRKLETAVDVLCKAKGCKVYPKILLGIEISCADKNHVVGIFNDEQSDITDEIEGWLDENLLSKQDGSFKTSIEVLEFIKSIGGIGYLAHINTSDILSKKYLSGAYKQKLFSDNVLQAVGVTDKECIEYIKDKINSYRDSEIKVVLDNDAHDIDTIPKNVFWIKGSKRKYLMIEEAFNDYDISVSFEREQTVEQYIQGIYIENSESGFLEGKDRSAFCLSFSKSLNCLIGGRGTGKSTVLELLEYVLSQKCENEKKLNFICMHGNTWILYNYHGEEFLIEMRMPIKPSGDDNILRCFGQNCSGEYYHKYHFNTKDVRRHAIKHYFKILKVVYEGNNWYLENVENKSQMASCFFDTRYSVNNLVNTASTEKINDFLYETLFQNKTLSRPEDVINIRNKSGLIRMLDNVKSVQKKRMEEVEAVIKPFNDNQAGILRIIYSQNGTLEAPDLGFWLFGEEYREEEWYKRWNIKKGSIIEYLLSLYSKLGLFEFLRVAVERKVTRALSEIDILVFCEEITQRMVDQEIRQLDKGEAQNLLSEILEKLITNKNLKIVINHIKQCIRSVENFSLEFNINNKEGVKSSAIYKSVETLSLGQKVVAMLSFVLGYSDYSKDYRPLIIDQPEDNLDNQYIYKNLVKQLRLIKEKRQVIIATHNATIVTNAKADQVCVMCSDNRHGWVETTGYPGEIRIKKHIIAYLEGGVESFKHKISIYKSALSKKK